MRRDTTRRTRPVRTQSVSDAEQQISNELQRTWVSVTEKLSLSVPGSIQPFEREKSRLAEISTL
jgi:hypothetical protein